MVTVGTTSTYFHVVRDFFFRSGEAEHHCDVIGEVHCTSAFFDAVADPASRTGREERGMLGWDKQQATSPRPSPPEAEREIEDEDDDEDDKESE